MINELTHKKLRIHGCLPNTVATDALTLKFQAIISNSADKIPYALTNFT